MDVYRKKKTTHSSGCMYIVHRLGKPNIITNVYERWMMLCCPNCQLKDIGMIGPQNYYCWNCFIEMTVIEGYWNIYEVRSDGTLHSMDNLFTDEERYIGNFPYKETSDG